MFISDRSQISGYSAVFARTILLLWEDNNVMSTLGGAFNILMHCDPAHTRRQTNAVLMLGHRLRRWPNIKTTLV